MNLSPRLYSLLSYLLNSDKSDDYKIYQKALKDLIIFLFEVTEEVVWSREVFRSNSNKKTCCDNRIYSFIMDSSSIEVKVTRIYSSKRINQGTTLLITICLSDFGKKIFSETFSYDTSGRVALSLSQGPKKVFSGNIYKILTKIEKQWAD